MTQVDIAKLYNVGREVIVNIKSGSKWKNVGIEYNDKLDELDCKTGEGNHNSILNEVIVKEIKELIFNKKSSRFISELYDISISIVNDIKKGRAWKHVQTQYDEIIKDIKSDDSNNCRLFSDEDIYQIKYKFVKEDISMKQLSEFYNVYFQSIKKILIKKTYCDINTPFDEEAMLKACRYCESIDNKKKLKPEDVYTIKKLMFEGKNDEEIAKVFNVTKGTINAIRLGRKWTKVSTEYDQFITRKVNRLTRHQADEIKELISKGHDDVSISNKYCVDRQVIYNIRKGFTWA